MLSFGVFQRTKAARINQTVVVVQKVAQEFAI
jgi:hypothetical protein